jgi:hypothetical protein
VRVASDQPGPRVDRPPWWVTVVSAAQHAADAEQVAANEAAVRAIFLLDPVANLIDAANLAVCSLLGVAR